MSVVNRIFLSVRCTHWNVLQVLTASQPEQVPPRQLHQSEDPRSWFRQVQEVLQIFFTLPVFLKARKPVFSLAGMVARFSLLTRSNDCDFRLQRRLHHNLRSLLTAWHRTLLTVITFKNVVTL